MQHFKLDSLKDSLINWGLFVVLSLIWGSSFLLMKIGLHSFTPYEVAAIRILSAGIVLTPFALNALRQLTTPQIGLIVLSGFIGSFIPAFLFCMAETQLDSGLTGMLNSLTPLFAVIIGTVFFQMKTGLKQVLGILIGLVGLYFLVFPSGVPQLFHLGYISLILLATVLYAINANLVGRRLKAFSPLHIASVAFVLHIPLCVLVLLITGFFAKPLTNHDYLYSELAGSVLGMIGTAFASVLFYRLVKRAGALFASMVTYGIPFIAAGWGWVYGEHITLLQMGCLGIILSGVYLAKPASK